jgi:hypothetical protein
MSSVDLKAHIPPLPKTEVECFEQIIIPLTITSACSDNILVESVTLRFQTDQGSADYFLKTDVGHEIVPLGIYNTTISVVPTPQFLPNTNEFDILVRYRKVNNGVLGDPMTTISPGRYLIVRSCSQKLGQIFVSFKQPEDRPLARLLKRVGERGGFQPYLTMDEPMPGKDLWERIEPRLIESEAVAFIWTDLTEWGEGVEREIDLCKANDIKYVLLVQNESTPPQQFKGTTIEYQRFDREDPLESFSQAIAALRQIMLSRTPPT